MDKKNIVIIAGPTAVGKSSVSIELAKKMNTEIISADSIQIYNYLDIGSAKVTKDEMCNIKHYMIDIVEPFDTFSVKEYKDQAFKIINELNEMNKTPILCGGTGFYINSIIYDMNLNEESKDDDVRKTLYEIYDDKGILEIRAALKIVDKVSYDRININDTKRNIRALEYYICTGIPFSNTYDKIRSINPNINFLYFALVKDREKLYDDINNRVDIMINNGLIEEVKGLLESGVDERAQSMQAIGYKEIIKYLKGEWDLNFAIDKLKQFSRNYAKRQLTWFRNDPYAKLIDIDKFRDKDELVNCILNEVKNEGFL